MEKNKLNHFKHLLMNEKEELLDGLEKHKNNRFQSNIQEEISELSVYDNHPGDIASETYQMELDFSIEQHNKEELKNIEEAINKIQMGNYGVCEICGDNILEERLNYLPASKLCSDCAEKSLTPKNFHKDRPVEEEILYPPMGRQDGDFNDYTGYDQEDAWQDVQKHSSSSEIDDTDNMDNTFEDTGIVEEVEEISNEEYRRQLPD